MASDARSEPAHDVDATLRWVEHEVLRVGTITTDETVKGRLGIIAARIGEVRFAMDMAKVGDKRAALRSAAISSSFLWAGEDRHECAIRDLSKGGALVQCDVELLHGSSSVLVVPGVGCISATVIASSTRGIQLAFEPLNPETEIAFIQAMESWY